MLLRFARCAVFSGSGPRTQEKKKREKKNLAVTCASFAGAPEYGAGARAGPSAAASLDAVPSRSRSLTTAPTVCSELAGDGPEETAFTVPFESRFFDRDPQPIDVYGLD